MKNEPLTDNKVLWFARNCNCCKADHPNINLYWDNVGEGMLFYKHYNGDHLYLEEAIASAVALTIEQIKAERDKRGTQILFKDSRVYREVMELGFDSAIVIIKKNFSTVVNEEEK